MRSEREIDDAIDRAVRDIMSAEPRAGFRGRVLGRLDERGPSTRSGQALSTSSGQAASWFSLPRFAAAMALLAMAIAIAALLRTADSQVPPGAPAVAQKEPAAAPEVRAVTPDAAVPVERQSAPAPRRERPRVVFPPKGVVAAASVADPESTTRAAQPVPAGPSGGSDPSALMPAPIVIAPLIVEPIVIRPIRPPQ